MNTDFGTEGCEWHTRLRVPLGLGSPWVLSLTALDLAVYQGHRELMSCASLPPSIPGAGALSETKPGPLAGHSDRSTGSLAWGEEL